MQRYLALGDSYTIGELVPLYDSFPYQLVQKLRRKGKMLHAPEIVAKTGWTTDEWWAQMDNLTLLENYDLITLLIGVNNQYRGRTVQDFEIEFEKVLQRALSFAHSSTQIFVLSIPDWGVMPFAEGKDKQKIAAEIDDFNVICKIAAEQNNIPFIDITAAQRADAADLSYVAGDGLHPSGKEYEKWANAILEKLSI